MQSYVLHQKVCQVKFGEMFCDIDVSQNRVTPKSSKF